MKLQHWIIAAMFVVAGCSSSTGGDTSAANKPAAAQSGASASNTSSSSASASANPADASSPLAASSSNSTAPGTAAAGASAPSSTTLSASKPGAVPDAKSAPAAVASATGPWTLQFNPPNGVVELITMQQTIPISPTKTGTIGTKVQSTYHTQKDGSFKGTTKILDMDMSALTAGIPAAQKAQASAQIKKMMDDLKSSTLTVVMDKKGKVLSTKASGSGGAEALYQGLASSMGGLNSYPDHPVKVGDTWKSETKTPVERTTTFKLVKVETQNGQQVAVVQSTTSINKGAMSANSVSKFFLKTGLPISSDVTTTIKNPQTGKVQSLTMKIRATEK